MGANCKQTPVFYWWVLMLTTRLVLDLSETGRVHARDGVSTPLTGERREQLAVASLLRGVAGAGI